MVDVGPADKSSSEDEDDIPMPPGPPPGGYSDDSSNDEGGDIPMPLVTPPPGFIPPLPKGKYYNISSGAQTNISIQDLLHLMQCSPQDLYSLPSRLIPILQTHHFLRLLALLPVPSLFHRHRHYHQASLRHSH